MADLPGALQNSMSILQWAWLIPCLPFFGFVFLGLFSRAFGGRVSGGLATLTVGCSWFLSLACARAYFGEFSVGGPHPSLVVTNFPWLRFQAGLTAGAGVLVDSLSLLLLVVATTVSLLVHIYSLGYMSKDPGFRRYFTYLNLFTASMLALVVAPNLLQTFVCWELVGVSSFLLIGFYYQNPAAVAASKKAFIVTRFADLGFLVGLLLLGWIGYGAMGHLPAEVLQEFSGRGLPQPQPVDFLVINHPALLGYVAANFSPWAGLSVLTWITGLIFMGAAGKSAMFPLHIWLPDAMEGPTPVSALIHAATMVVAGVYLVARLMPVFEAAGVTLTLVAGVGAFTCLFAAVIGTTQDDIKRILAFSTLSQLGYMMFALGVSSSLDPLGYTASMFHLFTHAFFKALLFLGAGAVIHACHTNNIWEMGGLRRKMPWTHFFFLVATLAIAGVPPFAGFFSKDEILTAAYHAGHPVIFAVGVFVAGLTAFYMFRLYFVAFSGECRGTGARHAHEAGFLMLFPLGVLALLSVLAGFVPIPGVIHLGETAEHHALDWTVAGVSLLCAGAGIGVAAFLYGGGANRAQAIASALGGFYRLVKKKFLIDEVYLFVTHKIIFNLISRPIAWFDRNVVDRCVDLSGSGTRGVGGIFAILQSGQVQVYGSWLLGGAVLMMMLYLAKLL